MSDIKNQYSQEEIERKRILALKRRNEAQLKRKTFDHSENANNKSMRLSVDKPLNCSTSENFKNRNSKYVKNKAKDKQQGNLHFSAGVNHSSTEHKSLQPIDPKTFFNQNSHVSGKCYMISNERFVLEMSSFVASYIEIFKTIPSRLYDVKTKTWSFHINDYPQIIQKLVHSKSGARIAEIPKNILDTFRKNLNSGDKIPNIDLSEMDSTLRSTLMPFQLEGVCFGISKHGRCMIADDMGLGKTIQALGIAYYFKKDWPLLIISPSSLRYQWSEAIYNFLPSIPTHYVYQFTNTKHLINNEKIIIVSYDLLVRAIDYFEQRIFGFVILDESHVLKNHKTARFKAVQRITCQAGHVILLSGTPALSRPRDLYSQLILIQPHFMSFPEYGIRYCAGQKKTFGWDFTGSSNMQELQLLLKATCMIRRLKTDVLNQLPSKIRQVVILDPALVKASTNEMKIMSQKFQQKVLRGIDKHNELLQYYNESSIAKLKAVCNYVTDLLEKRKKCLIYAHHQNVLDAICDIAESMKIRYIRIDGRTNPEQRKYQVDKFQECDDYLIAVLSITTCNAGITLTAAHLVVFAELFWNPGILCQAEDRVHRIGQDNSVLIQYLVAKGTVDDYLWPLIQRKIDVLNKAGLDQNFSLSDANITNQSPEKRQLKLHSFIHNDDSRTHPNSCDIETKFTESQNYGSDTNEELLDIDIEHFNGCDWDEIL